MLRSMLLAVVLTTACSSSKAPAPDDHAALTAAEAKVDDHVTAPQLADWVGHGACKTVDANNDATRAHEGVIPGAIRLTDYLQYDVAELPADKATRLVFYCANEACGASHAAAGRAVIAGYTDVHVFKGGIAGWRSAGNKTQAL